MYLEWQTLRQRLSEKNPPSTSMSPLTTFYTSDSKALTPTII